MTKKQMKKLCKLHKITVPLNPTKKQLDALLFSFYSEATVIKTDSGHDFLRTDKESTEYAVYFTIGGYCSVKAECEEAVRYWFEDYIRYNFDLRLKKYEYCEILDVEIGNIEVDESEIECSNE